MRRSGARLEERRDRRSERGNVTVIAALALAALILFGALAIDVGTAWSSRTQSQNAATAAALAAAVQMIDQTTSPPTVQLPAAVAAASDFAAKHSTVGNGPLILGANDVQFGGWCPERPGFNPVDTSDPNQLTAVRVDVHLDGSVNKPPPAFLSWVGGYQVNTSAVAYLGFEGSVPPNDLDLPLAINGCVLSSDCCTAAFCQPLANPPNPCLADPTRSCLISSLSDFACWTANPLDLASLIANGTRNLSELRTGDLIDLQGGAVDVTVFTTLQAQLSSHGASWVVKLPVVGCDGGGALCASGPRRLTGSVCFEIQQVDLLPQQIMGHFVCPSDPLFQQCRHNANEPRDAGGCNYGMRATHAVLVQ